MTARGPLLATVGLFATIVLLGLPLVTPAAPLGIVSLQVAADVATAAAVLASWAAVPPGRLGLAHGLDLLLPFAYLLTLVRAARSRRHRAPRPWVGAVVTAAVVAAAADQLENLAMTVTLLSGPTPGLVRITRVAAIVKFVALAGAATGLVPILRSGRPAAGRAA
jgi:hypothetical protein